jgi:FeS assembly SUF system protein
MDGKPLSDEQRMDEQAAPAATPEPAANKAPAPSAEPASVPAPEPSAASQPPADSGTPPDASPTVFTSVLPAGEDARMQDEIVAALKSVYDPEIPSDIYELGLIYAVDVDADRNVAITMTLTAPGCPVAGEMPGWVENAVNAVPGVAGTTVTMSFDPPWDMGRMSDEARLALNMF